MTPSGSRLHDGRRREPQSEPGLIMFRYDAELFYANANRFVDDVEALIETRRDPVEWLILDASSLDRLDYSAGQSLRGLIDYLEARQVTLVLARVDTGLRAHARGLRHRPEDRGRPRLRQPRRRL